MTDDKDWYMIISDGEPEVGDTVAIYWTDPPEPAVKKIDWSAALDAYFKEKGM